MTSPRFDEEVDFHNYKSDFEWILNRLEKNIENFQKNFITGNYAECSDALTSIYFLDYDIWCLLDAQHDEIRKRR